MKLKNKNGGFTLIEMLIVVAIIGILVAIAVPALGNARKEANERKIQATEAAVSTAIKRKILQPSFNKYGQPVNFDDIKEFLLINGRTPVNTSDLARGTGFSTAGTGPLNQLGWFPARDGTQPGGKTTVEMNWRR